MSKEVFETIKKESTYIGILFLSVFVIFKIVFFNENIVVLFRAVLSLFWLFALPGYFTMLYWKERLDFTERLVAGMAISSGLTGVASYYAGLLGLNINYHTFLLPSAVIIFMVIVLFYKKPGHS